MRIAFIGSRDFPNANVIASVIFMLPREAVIVSGGAKGADSMAEFEAESQDRPTDIFKADWERYGKGAGVKRNIEMMETVDAGCYAFFTNRSQPSAGTKHGLACAINQKKRLGWSFLDWKNFPIFEYDNMTGKWFMNMIELPEGKVINEYEQELEAPFVWHSV